MSAVANQLFRWENQRGQVLHSCVSLGFRVNRFPVAVGLQVDNVVLMLVLRFDYA
jgi:hypothetical protein